MKKIIDNFSNQASIYKKYRPEYPPELYQFVLSLTDQRNTCWDCGTGNGQVAKELSKSFKKVYATDISEKQLNVAERRPNIEYLVSRAEQTVFAIDQFDLICVAQAIHWFDFDSFNREVKRVAKPEARICVWGYGLLSIESEIDKVIQQFYTKTIGPYWNKERQHIDAEYKSISFDFPELETPKNLSIQANWQLEQLIGYLNSWSSVQRYKNSNKTNPVDLIIPELSKIWKSGELKEVEFPIFMRVGLIEK